MHHLTVAKWRYGSRTAAPSYGRRGCYAPESCHGHLQPSGLAIYKLTNLRATGGRQSCVGNLRARGRGAGAARAHHGGIEHLHQMRRLGQTAARGAIRWPQAGSLFMPVFGQATSDSIAANWITVVDFSGLFATAFEGDNLTCEECGVRSQNHNFFSLIVGDDARENDLSKLFQSCFAKSLSFRQVALKTIWKACALPSPVPKADHWECWYQPPTPLPGGGRLDLKLEPGKESNFRKPIFLESKVGSVLGLRQIKKYKDHGVEILIIVTKNRPEVSHDKLQQLNQGTSQ